mmetsp:Transcript_24461/g.61520  ORF Transcript_24461/g.61520 Transcript_24461/m.61520 type:complete len:82 (+) Transcript_24461:831-1076(+)
MGGTTGTGTGTEEVVMRENALLFAALAEQPEVVSRLLEPGLAVLWARADIARAERIAANNGIKVDLVEIYRQIKETEGGDE